jgi:hypothetical protein
VEFQTRVVILVILAYALCSAIRPLFVGLVSLDLPVMQNRWSNPIIQREPLAYIRKIDKVHPPTVTETKVESALEVEVERSAVAHAAPKDRAAIRPLTITAKMEVEVERTAVAHAALKDRAAAVDHEAPEDHDDGEQYPSLDIHRTLV